MGRVRRYSKHASQRYLGTPTSGYHDRPEHTTPTTCAAYVSMVRDIFLVGKTILIFEIGLLHYYLSPLIGLMTSIYAALASSYQRPATHRQRK
jgi:hypothetical protein